MKFDKLIKRIDETTIIVEVSNMEKLGKITGSNIFKTIFGSENKITKFVDSYKRYDHDIFTGIKLMDAKEIKSLGQFNKTIKDNLDKVKTELNQYVTQTKFLDFQALILNKITTVITPTNPQIATALSNEFKNASKFAYDTGYTITLGELKRLIEKFKNSGLNFANYNDLITRTYKPEFDKELTDDVILNMCPTLKTIFTIFKGNQPMLDMAKEIRKSIKPLSEDFGKKTSINEIEKSTKQFGETHKEPSKYVSKFSWHFN